MPEQEFELYLSLLSRFLRLKPAQHGEIADELRDHLEARLEELTSRGLAHDEAIRQALDEFGDAAELANHFTQLAHTRRRRLIMRFTFGTAAALAASLLVAMAFWPETHPASAPQRAVAQAAGSSSQTKVAQLAPGAAPADDGKAEIESKLSQKIGGGQIQFDETPLAEVLTFLSEQIQTDILFDRTALEESGIALDAPVNLKIEHATLTARATLELILEPLKLTYMIRDGLVMVTTAEHTNQITVYNVRDLVHSSAEREISGDSRGRNAGPQAMISATPEPADAGGQGIATSDNPVSRHPGKGGMGMGGGGGMGGFIGGGGRYIRETSSLAELSAITIDSSSWEDEGGQGTIVQYGDLLVVKNSPAVQGKIKVLLDMLRTSAAGGPPTSNRGGSQTGAAAPRPAAGSTRPNRQ